MNKNDWHNFAGAMARMVWELSPIFAAILVFNLWQAVKDELKDDNLWTH